MPLSLVAEFSCCCVDAIDEQSNCGEGLDRRNVRIHQHESVNVGEVISVQSEDIVHGPFDNRAATIMLYGVLGGVTASEKANVVASIALLEPPCSVPFVPYCAKDSRPDPRRGGSLQLVE